MSFIKDWFVGTPEKHKRVSTLLPNQQPLLEQAIKAGQGRGAGGAFGEAADYYRNLLSDNSADFNAFAAPQTRQFYEDIIPNLSEQFAGMGSGSLSSSGFRNAGIQAGTDLAERLGAIRANLRHSGAQGLQGIGQVGLGNFSQDVVTQQGTKGIGGDLLGAGLTAALGPVGGLVGKAAGDWLSNSWGGSNVGKQTGPYNGPGGLSFGPR